MDYQLVIKFWRKSLDDEAFLATLEAELTAALGKAATLDGYDVSAKEINLFMFTADPRPTFRKTKDVLEAMGVLTHGNVRVSLTRDTTAADVEAFCAALPEVVAGLRS